MTAALEFRGVTVRYPGASRPAVDELDLTIERGEIVALVGPSGAGKSTMIGLANGLTLPSQGRVEVLGVDTRELGRRRHRSTRARVGTVHQDFALVDSLRVVHNVAAGRLGTWGPWRALRSLLRPRDVEEISQVLHRVGVGDKIWERTANLSGGQKQRVAIARALFQQPVLFLADEPASNLDPTRSKSVLDILVEAAEVDDRALVTSLHDAPLAQSHCQRVIGLAEGRVVFDLPAGEVTEELLVDLYALEDPEGP